MRKINILLLVVMILASFSITSFAQQNLIAVMPIEEGDLNWRWFSEDEILSGITQMITDKLVAKEDIKVIERTRLRQVIKEQELGSSGLVESTTAAKIGRILGVDSIVLGTLTYMEVKEGTSIGFGPFETSSVEAEVALSGRLVDTTTAEIKSSFEGRAKASDRSFKISNFKGLSFGSTAFKESALGKSINQATDSLVEDIAAEIEANEGQSKEGKIVKLLGNKLIIKVATDDLIVGTTAKIVRKIAVEELDNPVTMSIGKVKIISISQGAVIAKVINSEEKVQKGDLVKF